MASDTVQTAGVTEGAQLENQTNCLHFLRVQPLQGTPLNVTQLERYATNLRLGEITTRMRVNEVKLENNGVRRERNSVLWYFCSPEKVFKFTTDNNVWDL